MRVHRFMATAFCASALCVTAASAGDLHTVGSPDLESAIAAHAGDQAAQRAAIQSLLARPQVRRLAASSGLDLTRASAAAAALDGEDLQRLAAQATVADAQLAGGDTIILTSTALLVILLIVLLVR